LTWGLFAPPTLIISHQGTGPSEKRMSHHAPGIIAYSHNPIHAPELHTLRPPVNTTEKQPGKQGGIKLIEDPLVKKSNLFSTIR